VVFEYWLTTQFISSAFTNDHGKFDRLADKKN
jgi:hypothetical protein